MKKSIKNNLISLSCALALVALGGGIALNADEAKAVEMPNTTDGLMVVDGAELRLKAGEEDQTGNGLRFVIKAPDATELPEGATETGTLVIPSVILGDAELNVDLVSDEEDGAFKFDTTEAWNVYDDGAYSYAYFWNMPEEVYNVEFTYRGYIVIGGETYYTESATTSLAEVALEASLNGDDEADQYLLNYDVTFVAEGEEDVVKSVKYGSLVSEKPADPEKANHTFEGWFVGETEWNFATNIVTGDITLTAKFAPIPKTEVTLLNTRDIETKVDTNLVFTDAKDANGDVAIAGEVESVTLGGVALDGWSYDDATDTLTLPTTALVGAELGEGKFLVFETATHIYTQKVWVVNKVIKSDTDMRDMFNYADINRTTYAIDGYFVLGADITCEQRDWQRYGTLGQGQSFLYATELREEGHNFFSASAATLNEWSAAGTFDGFVGTFDGRGYAISKLPAVIGGLFYKIGEGGVVKNLILGKVNLLSGGWAENVTSLAMENHGTIEKVMFSVAAMARQTTSSGLVMKNYGTIQNIYARIYPESKTWADHFWAIGENQTGGTISNVVLSTNFPNESLKETANGVPSWLTKASGDGYGSASAQWYIRFGSAANGYCSTDGTNGRDGVFVIISDKIPSANITTGNGTAVNKIS